MNMDQAYQRLVESSKHSECDAFDIHVAASILALALAEAKQDGRSVCDGVGLDGTALQALIAGMFPAASATFEGAAKDARLTIDNEEQSIRDLLWMYSSNASPLQRCLAAMIARRCSRPHHLWQDLGLRNRDELSCLMQRHFAKLAGKNHSDMKWKKFLYRLVCSTEGFTLCTAPVCSECDDFAVCFGAEDGEALLARIRNGREMAV